ncbi:MULTISPECIES: TetR/AcrR family transcriptional regulator [Paraburkholderia]|uniref:TetR/AcrR family transcriptional regulator n=1 Tax=Paraburkholderia TaxID=1822464 RepID=UPI0022567F21|nr:MULTISPECIES: WHG domain-containing protein [Paraburkholderia]MCX4161310.1 WHG domain-containing protein [Paraburkholderia megapolitana]MDN7156806.1 WHG domain-containing protein [Paraburkholderia sp. CHISQ3]MDQ6493851.1 WHG domain-containing protein [Paraburkholderia megapolitana]
MSKHTSTGKARRPYHHGALREAMLEAAERILNREGIEGLTLRAAAREAGASHAAPKNHFENLTGLLSDLAIVGFQRFERRLLDAAATVVESDTADTADAPDAPNARLPALGRAYVEFATQFPGLFMLMFRSERLDLERPGLREAMSRASSVLRAAVGVPQEPDALLPTFGAARVVAAWALVHGFAMLKIDGRLNTIGHSLPEGIDAMALLDVILDAGGGQLTAPQPLVSQQK